MEEETFNWPAHKKRKRNLLAIGFLFTFSFEKKFQSVSLLPAGNYDQAHQMIEIVLFIKENVFVGLK